MEHYPVDDERLIIFGNLMRIGNRLQTVLDKQMDDLSAKQWYILMVMELFSEPPTLKQLADASDSSYQNVKQIVLKLEQKGFVKLLNDPNDKRAKRVHVTAKKDQWGQANEANASRFVEEMFHSLTPDEIHNFCQNLDVLYRQIGKIGET